MMLAALALFLAGARASGCQTVNGPDTQPPAAVLAKAGVGFGGRFHGNGKIWTYKQLD